MNSANAKEKVDIIQELVRKKLIFGKQEDAELEIAPDLLKVDLHVSIIRFLSSCALGNIYGVQ